MPCKCSTVVNYLEQLAPSKLSQGWDNTGLLLGDPEQQIEKILVTLDITKEVVDEAIEMGANLIITHHPIIFKPISSLRKDKPQGDYIIRLIQNGISVYSAHTNLDVVKGGVNDALASVLGLRDVEILQPIGSEQLKKIVVFVPVKHVNNVREAMCKAGAGFIGKYSDCSFISKGIGTFKPLEGSDPYIGSTGSLEQVEECKIESIVPENAVNRVVKAMLSAHPYEEVAYDIFKLENVKSEYGFARIGKLPEPMELGSFAADLKKRLGVKKLRLVGDIERKIKSVIISAGAYSNITQIAKDRGADVIVSGDLKYHDARELADYDLCAVDAGHFATENVIVPVLTEYISKLSNLNMKVQVVASQKSQDIFIYF